MIDRNQYDSYMRRAKQESLKHNPNGVGKPIPIKEFEDLVVLAQKESTSEIRPLEISMTSDMERWVFLGNVLVRSIVVAYEKKDDRWIRASNKHSFTFPDEIIIDEYKRLGYDEVRLGAAYDVNNKILPDLKAVYVRGEKASQLLCMLDRLGLNGQTR